MATVFYNSVSKALKGDESMWLELKERCFLFAGQNRPLLGSLFHGFSQKFEEDPRG